MMVERRVLQLQRQGRCGEGEPRPKIAWQARLGLGLRQVSRWSII